MSQDIIFNQKKKEKKENPCRQNRYNNIYSNPRECCLPIRSFEPLSKVYDYVSGYNQEEQKFIYGMVTHVILAEKGWCYCVRPEKHDAFWTRLIM